MKMIAISFVFDYVMEMNGSDLYKNCNNNSCI